MARARLSRVTLGITGLCVIRLRVWGSRIHRPPRVEFISIKKPEPSPFTRWGEEILKRGISPGV